MCRRFTVYKYIVISFTIVAKLEIMITNRISNIGLWNMRGYDTSKSYIIDMFSAYDIVHSEKIL